MRWDEEEKKIRQPKLFRVVRHAVQHMGRGLGREVIRIWCDDRVRITELKNRPARSGRKDDEKAN